MNKSPYQKLNVLRRGGGHLPPNHCWLAFTNNARCIVYFCDARNRLVDQQGEVDCATWLCQDFVILEIRVYGKSVRCRHRVYLARTDDNDSGT